MNKTSETASGKKTLGENHIVSVNTGQGKTFRGWKDDINNWM